MLPHSSPKLHTEPKVSDIPSSITNHTALSASVPFHIPESTITLNIGSSTDPLPGPDINVCIANALSDMFDFLLFHTKDEILPIGYSRPFESVYFAIVETAPQMKSRLLFSDMVQVLRGCALVMNGAGSFGRLMEVVDDRRGALGTVVLWR